MLKVAKTSLKSIQPNEKTSTQSRKKKEAMSSITKKNPKEMRIM